MEGDALTAFRREFVIAQEQATLGTSANVGTLPPSLFLLPFPYLHGHLCQIRIVAECTTLGINDCNLGMALLLNIKRRKDGIIPFFCFCFRLLVVCPDSSICSTGFNLAKTISFQSPIADIIQIDGLPSPFPSHGKIRLTTAITHLRSSELTITLKAPNMLTAIVTSGKGGGSSGDFSRISWTDEAEVSVDEYIFGPTPPSMLAPSEPFSNLNDGTNLNGIWMLTITDNSQGNNGVLEGWTLVIDGFFVAASTPLLNWNLTLPSNFSLPLFFFCQRSTNVRKTLAPMEEAALMACLNMNALALQEPLGSTVMVLPFLLEWFSILVEQLFNVPRSRAM